jgi:hypothetical protein
MRLLVLLWALSESLSLALEKLVRLQILLEDWLLQKLANLPGDAWLKLRRHI